MEYSSCFIMQSYFAIAKNIRINSTHYFIIKIPNKQELHLIIYQILTLETFKL